MPANSSGNPPADIHHHSARCRFELMQQGQCSVLDYSLHQGVMAITHTFVPPALRSQGTAAQLVRAALDTARAEHWKVDPLCPYAAVWMERHPEYGDLHV